MTAHKTGVERKAYRVSEFSEAMGWSDRRTWAMIAAGKIRVLRFGRRCTRVPAEELDRLLASARSA